MSFTYLAHPPAQLPKLSEFPVGPKSYLDPHWKTLWGRLSVREGSLPGVLWP